jgi:3-phosphoshikimate 1-carboxyvinyltransferase
MSVAGVLDGHVPTDIKVYPSPLSGTIAAIPSKSFAQRTLIAAALSNEPTEVLIDYLSDDVLVTLSALESIAIGFDVYDDRISVCPLSIELDGSTEEFSACPRRTIHELHTEFPAERAENFSCTSNTHAPVVNCGESGTVARLLLPVLTACFDKGTLSGEGSLLRRPFELLCKTLEQSGSAQDTPSAMRPLHFDSYSLPLTWSGRLQAGNFELPGNESSQYVSGLMYALPLLEGDSTIELTSSLESYGYVLMTIEVLKSFGICIKYKHDDGELRRFEIAGGQEYTTPQTLSIEGDWSNAAFWLAAGVEVTGLKTDSLQRDRHFQTVKDQYTIDATDIPDLVPILSVYAALHHDGPTCIKGIKRLRLKESDRIKSTLAMLEALGCKAELCSSCEDELFIYSHGEIPGGGVVDGAGDHRIVMAAAIAASNASEPVVIKGAQAVAKTYGRFFEDFNKLGGKAHVIELW